MWMTLRSSWGCMKNGGFSTVCEFKFKFKHRPIYKRNDDDRKIACFERQRCFPTHTVLISNKHMPRTDTCRFPFLHEDLYVLIVPLLSTLTPKDTQGCVIRTFNTRQRSGIEHRLTSWPTMMMRSACLMQTWMKSPSLIAAVPMYRGFPV